jgi:acetylornithine deacetylase/succinyl-diaminopimelate desuccinylase-like protein
MSSITATAKAHRARLVSSAMIIAVMLATGIRAKAASSDSPPPSLDGLVEKAPGPKPIDYAKLTEEATDLLAHEIRINTTNPPGDELHAARLLKGKFLADGIPATVWEPRPGRGIVAARLHGTGRHNPAVVLLSHLDVVPANPREWEVPPFSGEVKDGAIWGRGAIDDKGPGVIELMAMLAIKRAGLLLNRDIIFIATGDEEEGGRNGAGWMVENEADVFADAGSLINEGGGIMTRPNGRRYYAVSITEKTPLWIRLTASGTAGHAAAPPDQTAVTGLVQALDRVIGWRSQIHLIDPVRDYFKAIGELDGGPPELLDLGQSLRNNPGFAKQFLATPRNNALVRDTFTPTVLAGSAKTNVIPATATAELDGRILPGADPQTVLRSLRKTIADDSIKTDVILNFPAASSPRNSALMTAIGKLAADDQAAVVPMLIAGFTDSHYFRQKGLIAYGFIPIELSPAEEKGVHGDNERLPVKELGNGIKRMVKLLETIGGK